MNRKKKPLKKLAILLAAALFGQSAALWQSPGAYGQTPDRGLAVKLKKPNGQEINLYEESYALVIGVSHYTNGWPDLPGVLEDIKAVRAALEKSGFHAKEVLNPTRQVFDREMRDFISQRGQAKNNRLVIYFAGHGHTLITNDGKGRQMGYIIPSDAMVPPARDAAAGDFKRFAINMNEIDTYAREIESKHALFVFDSCFSGVLFKTRGGVVPDAISVKAQEPVRQFITAGSDQQSVPDKSIFRRQFISALEGEADTDCDGFVTGTELGEYLFRTVTNYSNKSQTPQHGKINDPDLDRGDIVFNGLNRPANCAGQTASFVSQPSQRPPVAANDQPRSNEPPRSHETPRPSTETSESQPASGRWQSVEETNITVKGNAPWTQTPIRVEAGEQLAITGGSNQINLGANGFGGLDGIYKDDPQRPMQECLTGALIARIGAQTVCVGRDATFTSTASGNLQLGINESRTNDNNGMFVVRVRRYQFK
jgi:caspase domain-containing protein